jgi:hypothetical protein
MKQARPMYCENNGQIDLLCLLRNHEMPFLNNTP